MLRPLHPRRSAFTLIELLIVIAIIAVLAALLLAGISTVRWRGYDAQEINDIKQLEIAINNFKTKYHMYPPSRIVLYSNRAAYLNAANPDPQLRSDSLQIINRMWPNIGGGNTTDPFHPNNGINWASTVNPPPAGFPANGVILESDQCLVWALGGHFDANQGGCMGFSTNQKNPSADGPAGERRRDFDFPAGRLNTSKSTAFPSFMDNYDQMPILYFAPGLAGSTRPNRYNRSHAVTINYADGLTPASDTVSPYYDGGSTNPNPFWNPKTFQIITAGKDGRFGLTLPAPVPPNYPGDWRNGVSPNATERYWKDNRTNFSSHVLGAAAP